MPLLRNWTLFSQTSVWLTRLLLWTRLRSVGFLFLCICHHTGRGDSSDGVVLRHVVVHVDAREKHWFTSPRWCHWHQVLLPSGFCRREGLSGGKLFNKMYESNYYCWLIAFALKKKKVKGWRLRSLSKHDCTKGGNPPPNLPDNLFDSGVSFRVGRIVFFLMLTVSQKFQMGMPWSNVKVQLKPVFVSKKEIYFLIILSFLPRARRQSRPDFFFLCFI